MNRILAIIFSILFTGSAAAQCLTYPVPVNLRTQQSDAIIEGKVLSSNPFWNPSNDFIYTAHLVLVTQVFKGKLLTDSVYVITEGGTIGTTMIVAEPSLELSVDDAGVFFLEHSQQSPPGKINGTDVFRGTASVQSLVRYHADGITASDPHHNYNSIVNDVHGAITSVTGTMPVQTGSVLLQAAPPVKNNLPSALAFPVIATITSPSTAGTFSTVTITGANFGPGPMSGTQALEFRDANNGGAGFINTPANHIISWSATTIVAQVPTRAGSGTIRVTNELNESTISAVSITINYNQSNVNSGGNYYQPDLIDDNGTGGYTYRYNNTFNGNAPAVAAFERAMQTWRCNTYVNFLPSGTTGTACQSLDGQNIVTFDGSCALPSGVLGVSYSYYSGCGSGNWYVNENDLKFRTNGTAGIFWNYGPAATGGGQFDFESVALHELGHSHQLGHTITPVTVMNYAIGPNTDRRTLTPVSEVAGGNDIMSRSTVANSCGPSPMIALTPANCSINAPVADFSASPQTGCNSIDVTFTDLSLGTPTSWNWSFPGGTPATFNGQNPPLINYPAPGTYNVTLTVSNPSGSDTETKTGYIVVNNCPPPVADFSATPLTVCEGQPVQFTDLSTNTPTGWSWTLPGSAAGTSALQNPVTTYPTAGVYDVTLTASNPYGSDTETKTSYITVVSCPPPPVPNISASANSVCEGATITFTDLSSNNPNYWQWTFPGGVPATSLLQNPTVTYPTSGIYTVTLTVSNSSGSATGTFTNFITVNVCSSPSADFSGWPAVVCAGQQVNFNDLSTGTPTSWSWSFPGGTPVAATAPNPLITYNTPGVYDVSLTATNAFGSGAITKTNYITVTACPSAGSGLIVNDGSLIHVENTALVTIEGGFINQDNGVDIGNIDNTGLITLTGDWTNNSTGFAFINSSPGETEFNGAAQTIRGTTPTHFYDLTLTGTGIKTLDVDAVAEGSLNLNDRELATQDHIMHVVNAAPGAITRTPALNDTPVQGFVSSTGAGRLRRTTNSTSSYLFPVGSSQLTPRFRPVALTPTDNSTNEYSVRFVNYNPTIDGFDVTLKDPTIGTVNPLWYQKINHNSGTSEPDVTLYFSNVQDAIAPLPGLIMVQWAYNAPPVQWRAINGVTVNGAASPVLSSVTRPSWPIFITENFNLAPESLPLPVELMAFFATCQQGAVNLKWVTASELNNSHFVILRSTDGVEFKEIGVVKGSGNSTTPVNYTFNDLPGNGHEVVYYKLHQYDLNGDLSPSGVISATCTDDKPVTVNLYPVPARDHLMIMINSNINDKVSIEMYNGLGQIVKNRSFSITRGIQEYRLDLSGIPSGVYFVKIAAGNQIPTTERVIIQR